MGRGAAPSHSRRSQLTNSFTRLHTKAVSSDGQTVANGVSPACANLSSSMVSFTSKSSFYLYTDPFAAEEKAMPSREEKDAKAARRARKSSDPGSPDSSEPTPSSPSPRRQDRPTKLKGLTKQTYSAYVTPPGSNGPPKKWHLTVRRLTLFFHTPAWNANRGSFHRPTFAAPPTMSFLSSPTIPSFATSLFLPMSMLQARA